MSNYPIRFHKKSHHYTEDMRETRDREAFSLILPGGAIEGWRSEAVVSDPVFSPTGYYGGVEIHSRTPRYEGQRPTDGNCDLLVGDTCYHDGSSMAFDEIADLFDDPETMYRHLSLWEPSEWSDNDEH